VVYRVEGLQAFGAGRPSSGSAGPLGIRRSGLCGQTSVELFQCEPNRDDVRRFARVPMTVGGRENSSIAQHLNTRISAIPSMLVVAKPDTAKPLAALEEIGELPDPGDPIPGRGRFFGGVSERNDQAAIPGIFGSVSVTGEASRQLLRSAPGGSFVGGHDELGIPLSSILPKRSTSVLPSGERIAPGSQRLLSESDQSTRGRDQVRPPSSERV